MCRVEGRIGREGVGPTSLFPYDLLRERWKEWWRDEGEGGPGAEARKRCMWWNVGLSGLETGSGGLPGSHCFRSVLRKEMWPLALSFPPLRPLAKACTMVATGRVHWTRRSGTKHVPPPPLLPTGSLVHGNTSPDIPVLAYQYLPPSSSPFPLLPHHLLACIPYTLSAPHPTPSIIPTHTNQNATSMTVPSCCTPTASVAIRFANIKPAPSISDGYRAQGIYRVCLKDRTCLFFDEDVRGTAFLHVLPLYNPLPLYLSFCWYIMAAFLE